MEVGNSYKILIGKPETSLQRLWRRWKDVSHTTMDLKEIMYDDVKLIQPVQDRIQ
jgi:hypothetical protein